MAAAPAIMALGPRGEIVICEVKSGPEDYLADRKWGEYLPFCDRFYFAVAPRRSPQDLLAEEPGLIVADAFGGAVRREAPHAPLAGARRRGGPGLRAVAAGRALPGIPSPLEGKVKPLAPSVGAASAGSRGSWPGRRGPRGPG